MKPGDRFLVMFEVQRLAEPYELVNGTPLGPNQRKNIWVAEMQGVPNYKLAVCSDGWQNGIPAIPTGLEGANFKT